MATTFATQFYWSDVTNIDDIQAFVDDLVATNDPGGDAQSKVELLTIRTITGTYYRYLALTLIDDEVDEPAEQLGLRTLMATGTLDGSEQADIQALIDLAEPTLTDVVGLPPHIVLEQDGLNIKWTAYSPTFTDVDTYTNAVPLLSALASANTDGRTARLVNKSDSSKVIATLQWDATEGGVIPVGKIDLSNISQNRFGIIASASSGTAWTLVGGHTVQLGDGFLLWDRVAEEVTDFGYVDAINGNNLTINSLGTTPSSGDILFVITQGGQGVDEWACEVNFGDHITAEGSSIRFWMADNGSEYGLYVEDGVVRLDFAFGTMTPTRINALHASVKAHLTVAGYVATSGELVGGALFNTGYEPMHFSHRHDTTYLTGHWRTELRRVGSGIGALIAGADGNTVPAEAYIHPVVSFVTDDPVANWRYFIGTGGWPVNPYGFANAAYPSATVQFNTDFDGIGFAAFDLSAVNSVSATFTEYLLTMSID